MSATNLIYGRMLVLEVVKICDFMFMLMCFYMLL